jgi:hypothetical protein
LAAELSFKGMVQEFGDANRRAIEDPIWNWPRGESPRDIVDTGDLRDSQKIDFVSDGEAVISWDVDYALKVHEGETTRSGAEFPARRWTQYAQAEYKPFDKFAGKIRRSL